MNEETQNNRLWQTRRLIELSGGTNAMAQMIGRSPAYITAIAGPNPQRNIGDKTAAVIEKAFELSPGDLDQPPPANAAIRDDLTNATVNVMFNAGPEAKELIFQFADWVVKMEINKKRSEISRD